jgi:hypothetical protein
MQGGTVQSGMRQKRVASLLAPFPNKPNLLRVEPTRPELDMSFHSHRTVDVR